MKSYNIRDVLSNTTDIITIQDLWTNLRQRQYYNAMQELLCELKMLKKIPTTPKPLKEKIARALEKIEILVKKLKEKL